MCIKLTVSAKQSRFDSTSFAGNTDGTEDVSSVKSTASVRPALRTVLAQTIARGEACS
jgi:hypothetical protein